MLEVVSFTKSSIKLRNRESKSSYEVAASFGHLDHAYCTTSHSSQGKTCDEVFISQPAATFPATDQKQLYVSISRGRYMCNLYTDDLEQLLDYAERTGDRQSAMELVAKSKSQPSFRPPQPARNAIQDKEPTVNHKTQPNRTNRQLNYEP